MKVLVIDAYFSPRLKHAAQVENLSLKASACTAHLQGPGLALAQEAFVWSQIRCSQSAGGTGKGPQAVRTDDREKMSQLIPDTSGVQESPAHIPWGEGGTRPSFPLD